jgi:sugar phosphate isomerase/epimerase
MQTLRRYGFRTAGYSRWSLADAFASIAGAGYQGVEVCLEHAEARPESLTADGARELARQAAGAGLEVASASFHADFEPPLERLANQARAVQLTRHLGTNVLILNASRLDEADPQGQWDGFARHLEQLLVLAQAEGVSLALEPEPGHFLHSTADALRLMEQLAHPCLGVNLDVGHAYLTDPDVARSITDLGRGLLHTHVEGMPAGVHKHLLPGQGDLDLAAVLAALDAAGYAGYLTVDLFDIAQDPEGAARGARAGLQSLGSG